MAFPDSAAGNRALFEAAPDGILVTTAEGSIVACNSAAERLFGYSREEIVGQNVDLLVPASQRTAHRAHRAGYGVEPVPRRMGEGRELVAMRKDGATFPVDLSLFPFIEENDLLVIAVVRDVTSRRAAEGLRTRLAAVLEATPDFVALADPDGAFSFINASGRHLVGLSSNDNPRDWKLGDFRSSASRQELQSIAIPEADARGVWSGETELLAADGQSVPCLQVLIAHRARPDGPVEFYATIARDIRDRKQIERAMHNVAVGVSTATDRALFEGLTEYLARTLEADFAFVGLLTEEATRVRTLAVYSDGTLIENFEHTLAGGPCETVATKKVCIYPDRVRELFPRDDLLRRMEAECCLGMPLFDSSGQPLGLVAILKRRPLDRPEFHVSILRIFGVRAAAEIERIRREEELRAGQRRFKALFDESLDLMLILDNSARFVEANRAALDLLGYSLQEMRQMALSELTSGTTQEEGKHLWQGFLASGAASGEFALRAKDGRLYDFEYRSVANFLPDLHLAVLRDITARKRLEEQYRQAQKMEAVGRLAGGVAHDFNNLLTVVLGYCGLLLEETTDPQVVQGVDAIRTAAERAAGLTRQLLAFSRRQLLVTRNLNLNVVVEDIQTLLRRLLGEDVEIVTQLDPRIGVCRADPTQIEQVVMNLVINARDAMPAGGRITIETRRVEIDSQYSENRPEVRPGSYVMLAITDTGTGMDQATLSRIFEPFFTTKEAGKGTGLGLSTVYGIVKQSGGYVFAYSEIGKGTIFKVYLPIVDAPADPVKIQTAPLQPGSETVLLVEDDENVREIASRTLTQNGYTVLETASGAEAVRLCGDPDLHIDLLITDMVMPGLSGAAVAAELGVARKRLRILYMSGYTDTTVVYDSGLSAPIDFLQKPFTPSTLLRKVREVLDS